MTNYSEAIEILSHYLTGEITVELIEGSYFIGRVGKTQKHKVAKITPTFLEFFGPYLKCLNWD